MLKSIQLKNFKCFADEEIALRRLTVLSGVNGMGKSTVLQSLLVLRQSIISNSIENEGALINGPLVSLGTVDDVLYDNAKDGECIDIIVSTDSDDFTYSFQAEKSSNILPNSSNQNFQNKLKVLTGKQFYYLTAERTGPRTSFPFTDHELVKYNPIGNSGEFSSFILSCNERKKIGAEKLQHKNQIIRDLRAQVETWMSGLGQQIQIHTIEHPKMDMVGMEFSFVRDGLPTTNYRSTNVGFGLTYSLPIFVTCLSAVPDSLVLIENPEAHLHPKGQVMMGKFLAQAASAGIQIILETHSDHVLNGIRIAVKQKEISAYDVQLHFFDHDSEKHCTRRTSPKINSDGRLDQWPDGFFDEWEKGLAELL